MDRDAANCEVNRLVAYYQTLDREELEFHVDAGSIESELESGGEQITFTSRIRRVSENAFHIWVTASENNWWRDERVDAEATVDFEP